MVKITIQTFYSDCISQELSSKIDTYECYSLSQVISTLTFARWQAKQYGNHSNVDLFYNGKCYFGAI